MAENPKRTALRRAAEVMGQAGGIVGGPRRATILTKKRKHDIAVSGAEARWRKHGER